MHTGYVEIRCVYVLSGRDGDWFCLWLIVETPISVAEGEQEDIQLLQHIAGVHSKVQLEIGGGHKPTYLDMHSKNFNGH